MNIFTLQHLLQLLTRLHCLHSMGLLFAAFFCHTSVAAPQTLNLNDSSDVNSPYAIAMLKLANEKLGNKYQFNITSNGVTKMRLMEEVNNGTYDVFWSSTNNDLETRFDPIRIPLFKGLLGHRIFIIRQGDQARFDNIKTVEDLKHIKMGSGTTWADTKILAANGLNVVKVNKYPNMFYMLDGARFDAFPRAVFEPFKEIATYSKLPLTVEKNLMLVYRMPYYLFVRKGNTQLGKDLETGLERAIADGSFEKLFLNDPSVRDVIEKVNMNQRRVIYLENPTASPLTPINRPALWVDPKTLGQELIDSKTTTAPTPLQ